MSVPTRSSPPPTASGREALVAEVLTGLRAVFKAQRRRRGRDARDGGLTFAQAQLLAGFEGDEALPASRLAERAGVGAASASGTLDTLEGMGVVSRERQSHDRRVVHVRLTDDGRRVLEARRRHILERLDAALAGLDAAELAAGARVLHSVAAALEDA